jgi:hypothetical protein
MLGACVGLTTLPPRGSTWSPITARRFPQKQVFADVLSLPPREWRSAFPAGRLTIDGVGFGFDFDKAIKRIAIRAVEMNRPRLGYHAPLPNPSPQADGLDRSLAMTELSSQYDTLHCRALPPNWGGGRDCPRSGFASQRIARYLRQQKSWQLMPPEPSRVRCTGLRGGRNALLGKAFAFRQLVNSAGEPSPQPAG